MGLADDREILEVALRQVAPKSLSNPVLTGWVVVVEFMDDTGDRWLTRLDAKNMTVWGREGMLHNALLGDWDRDDDE
ncbi:MAG TPA: hypothetical protein VM345_01940 [Acidimicrobiales bacterium]|nr:hypothetical protein [Acidimicrobiales bacterium]